VLELRSWLESRGVNLTVIQGNHDRTFLRAPRSDARAVSPLPITCAVGGWTIGHGHCPLAGSRTISGHLHPVLKVEGTCSPCFLAGPDRIILPAFSSNAAGGDVLSVRLPSECLEPSVHCIASTGDDLLDFGSLRQLRRHMRARPWLH